MPTPPRPIDSTLHGVTDYTAGTTLMTVFPKLAGIEGTRSARQIRIAGAIHAGYSTITDYPLGIVKVLPYKAHLVIDAMGALALALVWLATRALRCHPVSRHDGPLSVRRAYSPHEIRGLVEKAGLPAPRVRRYPWLGRLIVVIPRRRPTPGSVRCP